MIYFLIYLTSPLHDWVAILLFSFRLIATLIAICMWFFLISRGWIEPLGLCLSRVYLSPAFIRTVTDTSTIAVGQSLTVFVSFIGIFRGH